MSNKPMKPAPSRHTGGGHNSKTCPVCNPPRVSDAYRRLGSFAAKREIAESYPDYIEAVEAEFDILQAA